MNEKKEVKGVENKEQSEGKKMNDKGKIENKKKILVTGDILKEG